MSENPAALSAQMLSAQTESVENFLKAVFVLQQNSDKRVSTNALADALGVKAPSITDMARRMVDAGYIDYERYHGVVLTASGKSIALKIIRRHRLLELYLVRELGYALHEVHDEAESLEHAVSDRFVEAIAEKLGNPSIDPHGDPIPSPEGIITRRLLIPLPEAMLHTPFKVAQLQATSAEMLQYILDRDFSLDAQIEVLERDPFDGPITVTVNNQRRVIGHNVAQTIMVEPVTMNVGELTESIE